MNELSVYERLPDPLAAVKELGTAIAKSRMFGCESIDQGMVFAWECMARRCPPLSLTETYHVIDGKLSMRADAMLARFREQGGMHTILERTPDRAAVQLFQGGESREFAFTWEEAQQEGNLTIGKKGEVKTNWSTPRRRMQMLWARVVSDGVRAMCPEVCAGKYTPEDFGQSIDNHEDDEPETTTATVTTVKVTPDKPGAMVATEPAKPAEAATVVDTSMVTEFGGEAGTITTEQRKRIEQLYDLLAVPVETREAALRKRGVNSLRSLSQQQAGEILGKLESARRKAEIDGTIVDQQRLWARFGEVAQSEPKIIQVFKLKLEAQGIRKADLDAIDVQSTYAALADPKTAIDRLNAVRWRAGIPF